jgi:hypothetical protein
MLTYKRSHSVPLFLSIAAAACVLGSCGDDELTAPTEGTIEVTTNTSGSDVDEDGYTVSVDGGTPQAIGIDDTVIFPEVEPGDRPVVLGGVAQNCIVGVGLNQRIVAVPVADTVRVVFTVSCEASEAPPPGGGGPTI